MGFSRGDDAGVYRLTADQALIQTVDVLTPIVDDPYDFGRIAAANALSDVYAMGGKPLTALNIVGFPAGSLDIEILQRILEGGLAKLREAGCALVGGHSLQDPELKYGLSVTGIVHPDKLWQNQGLRPGDALVLTKPLGTGILSTAVKAGKVSRQTIAVMTESMATLNDRAAAIAATMDLSACTDVTGFGLVGHACEMIDGTGLGIEFDAEALPLLPEVEQWSRMGLVPGGLGRNMCHRLDRVDLRPDLPEHILDLVFDPQTSGGLLLGLPAHQARRLVEQLQDSRRQAALVAKVVEDPDERIRLL